MDGVLVVDKPSGPTSHDVVAIARRCLCEKRVGHTGTLDPLATGVLPLVIGRATRLASLLSATDKEYVAEIRFGATTPSYDAEGQLAWNSTVGAVTRLVPAPPEPPGVDAAAIEQKLDRFRGTILQQPPPYSAKKTQGVRAYRQARRGAVTPVLKPVSVTVGTLVLEEYERGLARVRLRTSAGFYVRSFAHDLGESLGCGAYLESLRRIAAAGFQLDASLPLDVLQNDRDRAVRHMVALKSLLPELPAVTLNATGVRRASHGSDLGPSDTASGVDAGRSGALEHGRVRLLDDSGELLGIAERVAGGLLHPAIVLM